ncbi:hypothetical protein [Duganella sp. BuS-21]|uniref:dCTP deaminase n=1 Tax=Duganella sp. BuS-21 TaxID=2943848 RepID=UPI0035A67437
MILPSQEIKMLSEYRPHDPLRLITPFDKDNLRGSSYDLTVGAEYYVGRDFSASKLSTEQLTPGQSFTIPPHAVCFILSTELIELPKNITAKVSLRMTHIYAGMVLTSQPPFDPGYKGRVVVMLHNLSSEPFYLRSGDRLATIEFVRLSLSTTNAKPHRSVQTLQEQLPKPLVSSLSDIAKISTAASQKVDLFAAQMMTVVALIVAVFAVPGFFSFSSLTDRLNEQKDQLKEMKEEVERNNVTIAELTKQVGTLKQKTTSPTLKKPPHDIIVNIENGSR